MTYYIQHKARGKKPYNAYIVSKHDFEQKVQDLKKTGLDYVVQRGEKRTTLVVID